MYDIYFDLNNMHQLVEDAEITGEDFLSFDEASPEDAELIKLLNNTDMATLSAEFDDLQISFDFFSGIEYNDTDDFAVAKSENGLICKACKEFYPYAEYPNQKDGTFKCWGCRNF